MASAKVIPRMIISNVASMPRPKMRKPSDEIAVVEFEVESEIETGSTEMVKCVI